MELKDGAVTVGAMRGAEWRERKTRLSAPQPRWTHHFQKAARNDAFRVLSRNAGAASFHANAALTGGAHTEAVYTLKHERSK